MSVVSLFRPPRHLLALFLLVTLVPLVLLAYSGWQLLDQERALQGQRARESREQQADLAVIGLKQELEEIARSLEDPAALPATSDTAHVTFAGSARGRLLFYPFTEAGNAPPASVFNDGNNMELRSEDFNGASAWFGELAGSTDPAIRASALIHQARNLRRAGQREAALEALDAAARISDVAIAGIPADLFARWAACDLLSAAGQTAELRERALTLRFDLLGGRWQLDRATFFLHWNETTSWTGEESERSATRPPANQVALASAAEWIWNRWRSATLPAGTAASVVLEDRRMTVVWKAEPDRLVTWIAGPDYLEEKWFSSLPNVFLRESTGAADNETRRIASDTGLPWNIVLRNSSDDLDPGRLAGGRNLWLAGLGMLILLTIAGGYLIVRTTARELAVARLQSDFVAAVSHEFRTPLTSLRQVTEVLREGRIPSEEYRNSCYDNLARQSERLHHLVENLLDFGRMEAGTSPYRMERIDACAWIRSVVEQFKDADAARGHDIELQLDLTANETIEADPEALSNALWNLLDNAVKYSPDYPKVWVSAGRENDLLAIRVRDRGLGIAPEEHKGIFRKFVRGGNARGRSIKGTGIGLAMVDYIVKAHRGEVIVDSQPGKGSTFSLLLPCQES